MTRSAMRRDVVLHDRAKAFAPLHRHFAAAGLRVIDADRLGVDCRADEVLTSFVCFYRSLRHPLAAWLHRRRCDRLGIPVLTWNRDAPHYLNHRRWRIDLLDRLRPFDFYATHTLADAARRFGDQVLYLANAAEPSAYGLGGPRAEVWRRLREDAGYRWDVSFFGAMNGSRFKEMREREAFLTALAQRLRALGLRVLFREAAGMGLADQIELIQTSRININVGASCEYGGHAPSGLPERCYGIPAAGGFLLCDKRSHAADDFTVGENWAEFDGLDDCVAQIGHWLAHPGAARDLAERCHDHVMMHHTYAQRVDQLHALLMAWHARGGKTGERLRPLAPTGDGS